MEALKQFKLIPRLSVDDKALLLKTILTYLIEHGKIELVSNYRFYPYNCSWYWEVLEEKDNHQPAIYKGNLPGCYTDAILYTIVGTTIYSLIRFKAHSIRQNSYLTIQIAKNLRVNRHGLREKQTTTFPLKEHSNKMTPKDTEL